MNKRNRNDNGLAALDALITVKPSKFLRCIHGYGLCLWRLERFDKAEQIFTRVLWLNPPDNQGVRFLIEDVRARRVREEGGDKL
jgi:tetratricopeptide (TPR) repeat protein